MYAPTSTLLLEAAQSRLLGHFCKGVDIQSRRSHGGINYIVVEKQHASAGAGVEGQKTLLLVHGFGSGLGFFLANYVWLSTSYSKIVAIDLLGMGGSVRPSLDKSPRISTLQLAYKFMTGAHDRVDEVVVPQSTKFFTSSIEQFVREEEHLFPESSPFHVAAHSMGALVAWKYMLSADPKVHRPEALILLSPFGIPSPPLTATRATPSYALSTFRFLWENNVTPQQLVRLVGSQGRSMITNVLNRRFNSRWDKEELDLIAEYFYQITAAPASGEYAMNSLMIPLSFADPETPGRINTGIFAKRPISLDVESCSSPAAANFPPVLVLFGDHDWLRFPNVEDFVQKANAKGYRFHYRLISEAGHHLYLDNPDEVHAAIHEWRRANKI